VANIVDALIGPDVDIFQSQFIFKNPGAWGQPWHQDAHYFPFDTAPQVGVWLAVSEATMDNGCLAVAPGSHLGELLDHGPDKRPSSNYGYLEIDESDFEAERASPMLMQPGDLLVFHSKLVHRSFDNMAKVPRKALVLHYGKAGTKLTENRPELSAVHHWREVRRAG
jgi:ectoine hydroxylase-related dioxygenase (phytanoyl-CoA dioxygenase family)